MAIAVPRAGPGDFDPTHRRRGTFERRLGSSVIGAGRARFVGADEASSAYARR